MGDIVNEYPSSVLPAAADDSVYVYYRALEAYIAIYRRLHAKPKDVFLGLA